MTSLPGVLTAIAGLVTAVTGGIGLYLNQNGSDTPPAPTTVAASPTPQEEQGQVVVGELETEASATSGDDEVTALVDDCLAGDGASCDTLLDLLAEECYAGYLFSCDVLFEVTVPGSAYEDYGATCGGRVEDWTYAGVCSEA
ncbi:hypothetical protein [Geodermatophilus sp. URMC 62]|uniref:hypothetical protein n=1 Tax=Geodermatophilus sp. URMC 62 TaxID=3423414 RepID=UPI00406C5F5B